MLLTDDDDMAATARDLREYDSAGADRLRYNYKMTDLAAAIGRVQLRRLPGFVERRREIASIYYRRLQQLDLLLPPDSDDHIYYRFVVRGKLHACEFVRRMQSRGVLAREPVFQPLHRELGYSDVDFPVAANAHRDDVSLPLYPSLEDEEIDQVVEAASQVSQVSHEIDE